MIKYKGYVGQAVYDDEAKIFHGRVIGLKDVITFQGTTVNEIEQAFKDAIDFYLNWCRKRGEKPEKTFSGNLHIRIDPTLHAEIAKRASIEGVSLNSFIIDKLRN